MTSASTSTRPKLRPEQVEAIDLLLTRNTAMIALDPGMGKSRAVIEALHHLKIKNPVLIVCPAVARWNWIDQFDQWSLAPKKVVACKASDLPAGYTARTADVFVVSFDSVSTLTPTDLKMLWPLRWGAIIIDEAHRLKERTAKRTKHLYGAKCDGGQKSIIGQTKRVWLLSGTPARNHLGELWTHLRALVPEAIHLDYAARPMSPIEFEDRYCVVRADIFGRHIVGSKNSDLLLKNTGNFVLRRREQPGSLPPLTISNYVLDPKNIPVATLKSLDERLREVLALDPDPVKALAKAGQHISTERAMLGQLKAPLVAEWVIDFLNSTNDKIVLFAHHKAVIADIAARLDTHTGVVTLTGETPDLDRKAAIQAFQSGTPVLRGMSRKQNASPVRVFIGQTVAAGEAITLTRGNTVMMAEPSWVPAENFQAIKRVHRTGQGESVRALYAVLGNTLDMTIMKSILRKTNDLADII